MDDEPEVGISGALVYLVLVGVIAWIMRRISA